MTTSDFGGASWRLIVIQVLVLSGLLIFFKFYLPHRERNLAATAVTAREQKINSFFQDSVMEDSAREFSVPLDGAVVKRHPQKLRTTYTSDEVESVLGIPNTSMVDFRGGQHLTWIGTSHKLEAAFNAGRLYCLIMEDLATRHGAQVYESEDQWRPY
jgi:hypothetical protein